MIRKLTGFLCLMLAAIIVLTACSTSTTTSPSSTTSGYKRDKDLMRIAITLDPMSLDVGMYDNCYWKISGIQIYETLYRIGPTDPTEIHPNLALSYEWNDDYTAVTYEIREGVKFHDGSEMTAEDVAFSINRNKTQPVNSAMGAGIDNAEVLDDAHVRVNLKYPFLPILDVLSYATWSIYPKAYIEKCEKENINLALNPVGSGPWRCTEYRSNESISYTLFEDYWGEKPTIKNLKIDIIPDAESALVACEAGDYEGMIIMPGTAIERMQADPKWQRVGKPGYGTSWYYLGTNMTDVSVMKDNQNLRRACSFAVDREAIASMEIGWVPTVVPGPLGVFGYMEDFEADPHDPDKAKEYLTAAGYPDGISGLRYYSVTNYYFADCAIVCQAQLKEVGIEADLQILERGVYLEQCTQRLDYDLVFWAFGCAYPDIDAVVFSRFDSQSIGGNVNICGIQDPVMDDLILRARTSIDKEERLDLYREIFTINRDNAWYIPVRGSTDALLITSDIQGVTTSWNYLFYFDKYYYV